MQGLDPGRVWSLQRAAGARITVRAGKVWITESGCADDVFLCAGQHHVVAGQGRVVIEPQGRGAVAWVDISGPGRPAAPRGAQRAWGMLARLRPALRERHAA